MKKINRLFLASLDRGQIVLILVLVTVVGLTIGLSLISRTITDIRISSQIEQSSRAFSAAEAGVETALRGETAANTSGVITLSGATADYNIENQGGAQVEYALPYTEVDSTQTVWLMDHKIDGSLDEDGNSYPATSVLEVCWGLQEGITPALLVTFFYKDGEEYKIAKKAYDSVVQGNNFILADTGGNYCSGDFQYRTEIMPATDTNSQTDDMDIDPNSKLILMRLQPLYQATAMMVAPRDILPVQGKIITSIGQTETGVVRKIQVRQGYPVLPSLLDFTFYSED